MIRRKFTTPLVTAGVIGAAILWPPIATAQPQAPDCQATGVSTTTCTTSGSVSIKTIPPVRAPFATPYFPGSRGGIGPGPGPGPFGSFGGL